MSEKTNEKKTIILILCTVLLTVAVLSVGLLFGRSLSSGSAPAAQTTPAETTASFQEQLQAGAPGGIQIPGFEEMILKAGQQAQSVILQNPEANSCYMVFTILLPDGKQIYKSGMLGPGSKVDTIYLDVIPDPGVYESAVLRYDCYTLEDCKPMNGAEIKFRLEVKQ